MNTPPLLCQAGQSVLLIIDIQQRLAGAMPEQALHSVVKHTGLLLKAAGLLDIPVVRTEQYPAGLGQTLDEIRQHITHDTCLEKTCFSCCGAAGFEQTLKNSGRRQVILSGMETHVCVLQTALELKATGYEVFVVDDAVCSRDKHNHKNALWRLSQAGIVISNTESVLFEWLRDAGHPHFKAISQLLR